MLIINQCMQLTFKCLISKFVAVFSETQLASLHGAHALSACCWHKCSVENQYTSDNFIPYIKKHLDTSKRVDVVPGYQQSCDHEEADTRMLLHLQDALDNAAYLLGADCHGKFHALLANHPACFWHW